jgi:uncharacterized C2H2 Zn-finger protein
MAEECASCGGVFATLAELVAHVQRVHGAITPKERPAVRPEACTPDMECALCGSRFPDREALVRHVVRPHYRSNQTARKSPAYTYA